ncbi:MAG: SNF2 helicase associated domain-containing protein, partial [Coriobacteriales bacterium]|nr:SNF2 helicase associated domain-containing protein [Coriobacteriales bacterium]
MKRFGIQGIEKIDKSINVLGLRLMSMGVVELTSLLSTSFEADVYDLDGSLYRVSAERSNAGNIKLNFSACTCDSFRDDMETCEHIVAAAYTAQKFLNSLNPRKLSQLERGIDLIADADDYATTLFSPDDYVDDILDVEPGEKHPTMMPPAPRPKAVPKPKSKPEKRTDMLAVQLMERRSNQTLTQLGHVKANQVPLKLEATINYESYHGYYLTLRVGAGKLFVVKDMNEFHSAVLNEQAITFGASTNLWLGRSAFEQSSLPLLDFFLTRHNDVTYHNYYYYSPPTPAKMMMLSRSNFDDLLAALQGCELVFADKDGGNHWPGSQNTRKPGRKGSGKNENRYLVCSEDRRMTVTLHQFADGAQLTLNEGFYFVFGLNHMHFVEENRIYTCSAEYTQACEDLLSAFGESNGRLYFHRADLPFLFTTVLPDVQPFLDVRIEDGLERFAPPPLTTRIYLDIAEDGGITARMEFAYGEMSHAAFGSKDFSEAFDRSGELIAEERLQAYMGDTLVAAGTLWLPPDDEEAIFLLATRGIEELEAIAELYVSEDFERIKVRSAATASVGVRVDGRLLAIDFDIE